MEILANWRIGFVAGARSGGSENRRSLVYRFEVEGWRCVFRRRPESGFEPVFEPRSRFRQHISAAAEQPAPDGPTRL